MAIQKIQSVYTVAHDIEKEQAFYQEALGLTLKFCDPSRWAQFSVGGSNFALSSVQEAVQGASGSVVVFEANGLDGIRAKVERAGGKFLSARDMGSHGRVLAFLDPENQIFQVFSRQPSV